MIKWIKKRLNNILILGTVALAGYGVKCIQEPVTEEPTIIVQQIDSKADRAAVARDSIEATAKLYGSGMFSGTFTGSAFFISDRVAITAGHCVRSAMSIRLEMYDGRTLTPDRWLHDNIHDCGILIFDTPVKVKTIPIRLRPVTLGEEVIMIGCPFGLPNIVTWGRVSNPGTDWLTDWAGELFLIDAWGAPGASGGVVLDEAGNMIGILVGGPNRTGASNCVCVPVKLLIKSAMNIAGV